MTPAVIIRAAAEDGVILALSPAGTIKATGDQAAVNRWLPIFRELKPAILAALAHSDDVALWWRVSILEPGGRSVEVDTPSGWTLGEWAAYAERYHGPGCAVTPIAGLPKPRAPVNLEQSLVGACREWPLLPRCSARCCRARTWTTSRPAASIARPWAPMPCRSPRHALGTDRCTRPRA